MGIDLKAARRDLLTILYESKASHIGSCLSALPIIIDVYDRMGEQDEFVLSKGHAAAALYTVLHHKGIIDDTVSLLTGHVDHHVPGVKVSTGSLGHGLPIACGMALRSKGIVYVLMSDGEMDCGTTWESAAFIKRNKINNLRILIDLNGWKAFDRVDDTAVTILDKFNAFGIEHLVDIYQNPKGFGVSFMEDKLEWHYKNMNKEEYDQAMRENA